MASMKDLEMPSKAGASEEEELFDFGLDEESPAGEASPELAAISDDDLIAEMTRRGFETVDEVESDDGSEVGPDSEILGEEPII